jgi:hypothetical protein
VLWKRLSPIPKPHAGFVESNVELGPIGESEDVAVESEWVFCQCLML